MTAPVVPSGRAPWQAVADAARWVIRVDLVIPAFLVLVGLLYVAAGGTDLSASTLACIVALHLAHGALFGYNNYRDRVNDAISWKRALRPLAGHPERVPVLEVLLVLWALASVAIPIALGREVQAVGTAIALAGYVALFANRRSRRQVPILKSISAVGALVLTIGGFLVDAIGWSASLLPVAAAAAWRFGWEMVEDVRDADHDRRNGLETPAIRYGNRPVLLAGTVAGALVTIGAGAWELATGDVLVGAAFVVAVLAFPLPAHLVRHWPDEELTAEEVRHGVQIAMYLQLAVLVSVRQHPLAGVLPIAVLLVAYPTWWRPDIAGIRALSAGRPDAASTRQG